MRLTPSPDVRYPLHRVTKSLAMLVQVMSQSAGVGACRMKLTKRAMDETRRVNDFPKFDCRSSQVKA